MAHLAFLMLCLSFRQMYVQPDSAFGSLTRHDATTAAHRHATIRLSEKNLGLTSGNRKRVALVGLFQVHDAQAFQPGLVVLQIIQQFRVNSARVDFLAHRALVNALYGDAHPCGYLVEEADYRRMCPALLQAFHERYYHAGNCTLYLSGKVTGDCLKRVEELFGTEPFGQGGASPGRIDFPVVTVPQKRVFVERADSLQSAVRMGMLTIDRHHADFMKLRVLVTLLGGYFGSRLMSNIREEKGYTYGVFANILSNPGSGLFLIHAETANEYVEPLIREVYAEMDKLRNEPVPAEELSMVQNYMRGEMCRNYESAFSLADAWIFLQTSGLEPSYYQEALETIRQVTPQDIGEMANKYLCKDNLKEIVSGKKIS